LRFICLISLSFIIFSQSGCKTDPIIASCKTPAVKDSSDIYFLRANATANKLIQLKQNPGTLWQRAGWWNRANILEALIDYNRLTGKDFKAGLDYVYRNNKYVFRGNFINDFFDDNSWWALAWIKAYDMTGEGRYLATAEGIFKDMYKHSWDTICGGGVRWNRMKYYKNAVTNELYITLAARLCSREKDSVKKAWYLAQAIEGWQWLQNSGMINSHSLFNDGLNPQCENNKGTTWTYNQGIILGGLKELFTITGDSAYLQQAKTFAYASMAALSNNLGVLTEPGGTTGGADKNQFKGIYIRYLAELNTVLKDSTIHNFILKNDDYAWLHARNSDNLFDFNWSGPFTDWSGSAQGTALDLMNAGLMETR
jgi:predicted alpha-1,6-mannanase (GH76 family)